MLQHWQQQKVWCAIRVYADRVDVSMIAQLCQTELSQTRSYVWALRRHGFLDWHEEDVDNHLFRLVRDTGGLAPISSSGFRDSNIGVVSDVSQRLWNVLRLLKTWDLHTLAAQAGTPYGTAVRYSSGLATIEYAICCLRDSRGGRNQYQLIRETGAIAPLFRGNAVVFDSNLFLQELWAKKSKKSSRKSGRVRA